MQVSNAAPAGHVAIVGPVPLIAGPARKSVPGTEY
jgi:hypothetical protein